jgi:glycosyltransferase involved in cell wall biosynthesis
MPHQTISLAPLLRLLRLPSLQMIEGVSNPLRAGVGDERGTLSNSDLAWGGVDARTSSKPRLGFVFSALNTGGAERHAVTLRARLLRRGYPGYLLGLVTADRRALLESRDAEGAIELGARRILRSPSTWIRTAQAMRRLDADVVFLVNSAVAVMAAGLRRLGLLRGKLVCVLHSTKLGGKERASWFLFRLAIPSLDALVFVGEAQRRYWDERGLGGRSLVINNGVDLDRFSPGEVDRAAQRRALGFQPDDYVVGISAALRSEKRHCDLVDALAGLKARGFEAKLLMVGDGPERGALEAQVRRLRLDDAVVFAGDQRDVRPFLAAMDVGVLCSDFETFSLAVLETLAMGVPLVGSDVGSIRQVVEPGRNGFIFEPRRVDQLVDQLSRLADAGVRSSMAAEARASITRFSEETMVERFEELVLALTRTEPAA